jgi:hypothetical protein
MCVHAHVYTHRQRALKALDDRLSKNTEPADWPSLDDAGSSSTDEHSSTTPSSSLGPTAVVVEKSPGVPISAVGPPPQPAQGGAVASGNGAGGSSTSLSSLSGKPAHLKGSATTTTTVGTKTDSSAASFKIESA